MRQFSKTLLLEGGELEAQSVTENELSMIIKFGVGSSAVSPF